MGKVSAFTIEGLDIYFNSLDHKPPHFHVECANWQIRVYIDSSSQDHGLHFEYKEPKIRSRKFKGITKQQRRMILEKVIAHRNELLAEWQEKVWTGDDI